jgi:GTP-binding protein
MTKIRITQSEFIKSAVQPNHYPPSDLPEFAFVGKSNVGKSSLINTILERKDIAKVSGTPGKTRLINFFSACYKAEDEKKGLFYIVDLPGYGFAKVSKTEREKWQSMILNYFANRENLKGVIVLVDIRHPADAKDLLMLAMLQDGNIPYIVAATKADKLAKNKVSIYLKNLAAGLAIAETNLLPFSSLRKTGKEQVLTWMYNAMGSLL